MPEVSGNGKRRGSGVVGQFETHISAAAKAATDFEAFTVRLKPRPFKTNFKPTHYWLRSEWQVRGRRHDPLPSFEKLGRRRVTGLLRAFSNCHEACPSRIFENMDVRLNNPEIQAKIDRWVTETGRGPDELIEDAVAGYFEELTQTREMLNSRYDDLKSGRVKPVSGDEVVAHFREKSAVRRSSMGSSSEK